MEGLRGDPVLGKYEKMIRLTHAPIERMLKNMEEDGVPQDQINRFERAYNGEADSPAAALDGDIMRMSSEKETRDLLKEMEARMLEKMERLVQQREERIIAAITGRKGQAPPEVAPPPPREPPREEIVPAKAPPPARRSTRDSTSASEVIESTMADPNKDNWVAIPGIKSTSGVQCEASCKEGYNKVRLDRSGIRWVIFEFDNKMEWIYPTKEGVQTEDWEADWDGFVDTLPDKKACYALYNFEYLDAGGSGYAQAGHSVLKNKMTLFAWTDSKCKVKDRMVAASSQSAIKQVCRGSSDLAVHDKVDMKYLMICKELGCNV